MLTLPRQILLRQAKVDQVKAVGVFEADHNIFELYIIMNEAQIVKVPNSFELKF